MAVILKLYIDLLIIIFFFFFFKYTVVAKKLSVQQSMALTEYSVYILFLNWKNQASLRTRSEHTRFVFSGPYTEPGKSPHVLDIYK